jgi:hypothetical protein
MTIPVLLKMTILVCEENLKGKGLSAAVRYYPKYYPKLPSLSLSL